MQADEKCQRDFRAEPDGSLFSQDGEEGIQLLAFDIGGGAGDDVAGDAAQDVGLVGGQLR